ncbi:hypothetical protein Taro_021511 [Colocasia esculenta]|uniref:Uncharacterized protein n=1 Tax=Colocasia esculenta TaxID=4460 RepID=A0A843URP1_COLES|nr:hypothetical protein [Colocasia esculenta]
MIRHVNVSLARLRPVRGTWSRVGLVIRLTGLNDEDRYRLEMADRRDWGGGGEESGEDPTQRMIERIWESLTDIRMRLDQPVPVQSAAAMPPFVEEAVPVAPVPLGVEIPPYEPVVPTVPARPIGVEDPTVLVERFLRLQPPTFSGDPTQTRQSTGCIRLRECL